MHEASFFRAWPAKPTHCSYCKLGKGSYLSLSHYGLTGSSSLILQADVKVLGCEKVVNSAGYLYKVALWHFACLTDFVLVKATHLYSVTIKIEVLATSIPIDLVKSANTRVLRHVLVKKSFRRLIR